MNVGFLTRSGKAILHRSSPAVPSHKLNKWTNVLTFDTEYSIITRSPEQFLKEELPTFENTVNWNFTYPGLPLFQFLVTEKVGVTVRLYSCIRNVLGCNLGRFSGSHD
jgi:hypothetical protein